jgi:hypothetical protein
MEKKLLKIIFFSFNIIVVIVVFENLLKTILILIFNFNIVHNLFKTI